MNPYEEKDPDVDYLFRLANGLDNSRRMLNSLSKYAIKTIRKIDKNRENGKNKKALEDELELLKAFKLTAKTLQTELDLCDKLANILVQYGVEDEDTANNPNRKFYSVLDTSTWLIRNQNNDK